MEISLECHKSLSPSRPLGERGEEMDEISDHLEMRCARTQWHHERRRDTLKVLASAIP